jgi:hypothetical protein
LRSAKTRRAAFAASPAFSPRMPNWKNSRISSYGPRLPIGTNFEIAIGIGDQLENNRFLKQRKVAFVNVDAPSAEHFTIIRRI